METPGYGFRRDLGLGERNKLKGRDPSPTLGESRDFWKGQRDQKLPQREKEVTSGKAVSMAALCSCPVLIRMQAAEAAGHRDSFLNGMSQDSF